jgi:membrane-associated protease RseP (regulator of RpoE activity)
MSYTDPARLAGATSDMQMLWLSILHGGLPFAVSLLAILLAHEFGHYLMTRRHHTAATLPYFIPFPTLLGTMGAVIVWKELPRNKRILFDVGIAGPLAGLVVAIPVVIIGLLGSKIGQIVPSPGGFIAFASPSQLRGSTAVALLDQIFFHWLACSHQRDRCAYFTGGNGRLGRSACNLTQSDPGWPVGRRARHVGIVR